MLFQYPIGTHLFYGVISTPKCLVNTEVSYEPPFDMNDSFEDILSDFIEKSTAA